MWVEVLVEGDADAPAVREVLTRKFQLVENKDFRIHPHKGRGKLPANPLASPELHRRGLLDQLPAKLRGFGRSLPEDALVLVVLDVDDDPCRDLLMQLTEMLALLPSKPKKVLFRLAIEETESWFIADYQAIKRAYSHAEVEQLKSIAPDSVVGAWERLAKALGVKPRDVTGVMKYNWADNISPHLNLDNPKSPSLSKLIQGLARELA